MSTTIVPNRYRQIQGWVTVMPETTPGTYIVPQCNEDGTTPDFGETPEIVIDPHKSVLESSVVKVQPMSKSATSKSSKQNKSENAMVYSEPVTDDSLFKKIPQKVKTTKRVDRIKVVFEVSNSPFRTISYLNDLIEVTDQEGEITHIVLVMDDLESNGKIQLVTGPYQMAVLVEKTNNLYLTSLENVVSFVYEQKEYYVLPVLVKGNVDETRND